jgi:hypothetical protein
MMYKYGMGMATPKKEPTVYEELAAALKTLSPQELRQLMNDVDEDIQDHEEAHGPKEDASMRLCQVLIHKETKLRDKPQEDLEREYGFRK